MRRLDLDTNEIVRLYVDEGLRGPAIAQRMGCSLGPIYGRLFDAGILRSKRARIDRTEAVRLYVDERMSLKAAAEGLGVAPCTLRKQLVMWEIPVRSRLESLQPRGRRSCDPGVVERSYQLGFACGDLWVRKVDPNGLTIEASCSTTHPEQVAAVRRMFERYGPVYHVAGGVRASLDTSFAFLLEKYERRVPDWVVGDAAQAAFAAGYIDAEGSFGVYEGRARFKLDSYDEHVLVWLDSWCQSIGVRSRLRRVACRGDQRGDGLCFNGDLWRLNVNESLSLLRFIATLDPFLLHERRRRAAEQARQNVIERLTSRVRPPTS